MPASKPLLVGITGGIGSGKSLICKVFEVFGVPVYDSDSRAKALMAGDPLLVVKIKEAFGEDAYTNTQALNRTFLAREVFSNPAKLQTLNELVHPAVGRDFQAWVTRLGHQPYVLKEAALLFETGSYTTLDATILVTAPVALRVNRVLARDSHRTEQQVKDIIGNQMPDKEKEKLADYVLRNDEESLLLPLIVNLHEHLLQQAAKKAQPAI